MSDHHAEPSPLLFFDTVNAYQRTAALKAALDLELFTAIAGGADTAQAIAEKAGASERGVRILSDYLVVIGFLNKQGDRYALTPDSAVFLDRNSPAYVGGATEFLLSPMFSANFENLTETVRKGTTTTSQEGTIAPEHPIWVNFARGMAPMTGVAAEQLAQLVTGQGGKIRKVLDVAAGHGLFGVAFARLNPEAQVFAQDWANVLEVAKENAQKAGVADRYSTIAGSAFDVDFGGDYDVILLTNFLHHFDPETNEKLLRKVHGALAEGGRVATLEFIPNEDRITPPQSAAFSMIMLASTPAGDAYTFPEFERMFRNAGFSRSEQHALPAPFQQVIISDK